jgi:hypothetical protein
MQLQGFPEHPYEFLAHGITLNTKRSSRKIYIKKNLKQIKVLIVK